MTSQTKHFIELSDIVGIQLECKNPNCGVSLLVSGESVTSLSDRHNMTLAKCPSCGGNWTVDSGKNPVQMGFDTEIKDFLRMLERVRGFGEKLGCQLRFEIKEAVASGRVSNDGD